MRSARVAWTVLSILIAEVAICGLAVLPPLIALRALFRQPCTAGCVVAVAFSTAPCYVAFALVVMVASALCSRVTGWRTPENVDLRIADYEWLLLDWVRYMVLIHVVRVFAGVLFRATPAWTAYMRLNGARVGRRVYVNSLAVSDHNLLTFGDDVVIGDEAHVAGHTIERGRLRTARIQFGNRVTVGLGSVVEIGVTAGDGCDIGALSLVRKYSRLEGHATYCGIPARKLDPAALHHHADTIVGE